MGSEFDIKNILENLSFKESESKPFEVTVDLREEKVRRNTQNILVSMERYEELIKAEQDAKYLKEWVNKTAKSEKSGYEVKAEAVVLNTVFNESEE